MVVQFNGQEFPMSEHVTPLRQRMIDDMAIRNMSTGTQQAYIRAVKNFSLFFRQSPDKLDFENVRQYRLHLAGCGLCRWRPPRRAPRSKRIVMGRDRGGLVFSIDDASRYLHTHIIGVPKSGKSNAIAHELRQDVCNNAAAGASA
jgi:hypothetical protein